MLYAMEAAPMARGGTVAAPDRGKPKASGMNVRVGPRV